MDNSTTSYIYAGFWIRWLAGILNSLFWALLFPIFGLYLLCVYGNIDVFFLVNNFLLYIAIAIIGLPYFIRLIVEPYLINKYGGTVGKLIFGLKIIREDGRHLTVKNALFREHVAKIASAQLLGLGYLWIFRSPKKQAWHDMLAGTYVIKIRNRLGLGILAYLACMVLAVGLSLASLKTAYSNKVLVDQILKIVDSASNAFKKPVQ